VRHVSLIGPRPAVVGALLLLWPWLAAGQDLERTTGSAVELGLAGAGVTVVQDPTALFVNPANLPRSEGMLAATLGLRNAERSYFPPPEVNQTVGEQPVEARDTAGVALAPSLCVALPLWRRRLWAAVGYHTGLMVRSHYPAAPTEEGGREDPTRYLGTELALTQHVISLGLALRWRWLAIGAALELSHLRFEHRRSLWAGLVEDHANPNRLQNPAMDLDARLSGRNTLRTGALIGLWVRPLSRVELAVTVRPPLTARVEGELTLEAVDDPLPPTGYTGLEPQGGGMLVKLPLPLEVRGGIVAKVWRLRLLAEAAWARWSTADDLAAELEGAAVVLVNAASQPTTRELVSQNRLPLAIHLEDRLSFHLGAELPLLDRLLVVRTGYAFHLGATRTDLPAPTLLDLDRHVLGLGLEVRRGCVKIGLALSHSFRASLESGGQAVLHNPLDPSLTVPVGEGRYTTSATRFVLQVQLGW
jgi:long-subunit fatty acid transport protein